MALSGIAFGAPFGSNVSITTATGLEGASTVTTATGMDFTYVTDGEQIVTTLDDSITIWQMAGSPAETTGVTLTLNIKNALTVTNQLVLGTDSSFRTKINTSITTDELSTLTSTGTVSRWVLSTGANGYINNFSTDKIALTLSGLDGYADGGIVFDCNGTYYAASDVTFDGNYATVATNASALALADETLYTAYKITNTSGASIKGVGFVATAPIPEPATATLSLLALAGLAARRRRK